jgi:hypothetical protein
MKKLKELYSSPNTTVLVVRFEETILQGSPNASRSNSASSGYDDDFNLGEI